LPGPQRSAKTPSTRPEVTALQPKSIAIVVGWAGLARQIANHVIAILASYSLGIAGLSGKLFLQEQWVIDSHITPQVVLRGLDPRIHAFSSAPSKAWMAGTSPAKTKLFGRFPLCSGAKFFPDSPARHRHPPAECGIAVEGVADA
jgi:hypothetical protein